jgi:predicted MFS family arabinose efflux permease
VVGSLVALIYGLVEAPSAGWRSAQTLGLLVVAAAGLGVFVLVEARVREPLVALGVFRRRTTVTALVLMIAGMGTVVSAFYFSSLYLQQILGHSALRAGLEFLPGAILLVLAAHAGGGLVSKFGAKPVLAAGMALGGLGALLLSWVSVDGGFVTDVLPGLFVLDIGIGLAASGIFITALSGVGERDAGLVSGLITTAHEVGVAVVLPVLSTIAASRIGAAIAGTATDADPAAVTDGFGAAFRAAAVIAFAATLLVFAGLRRDDVAPGTKPAAAMH